VGKAVPGRLLEYFDELYSRYGIELTEEQMAWYASEEAVQHEDMWAEFPSYPAEAFKVAQDGSYYGRCFNDIYRQNRICKVPYDPALPVYTGWDLGMSDDTSIWFLQFFGKEVRCIDFYAANGEGLAHYANVLRDRGYRYGGHFAPHDIAVRELGTGVSRLELAKKMGINFIPIPTNVDVMSGIENCREMLGYCYFDEVNCDRGIKALEGYKKEWNEKHGVYHNRPLHDDCSHGADAFRTVAVAWSMGLCNVDPGRRKRLKVTGGLR
jgi:hypothetical protein